MAVSALDRPFRDVLAALRDKGEHAVEMEQSIGRVISLARAREVLRGGEVLQAQDAGDKPPRYVDQPIHSNGVGGTEGGTEPLRNKKTAG